jgi:hypothetical protein
MNDPLINHLRDQAKAFDPEPPAPLRRRIFSGLAQAPAPCADQTFTLRWTIATVAAAAAAILVALAFWEVRPEPHTTPLVQTPQSRPGSTRTVTVALVYPTGNPIALAQRWVEEPLQNQINTLIQHLTSATDTLKAPFPSPVKHPRPDDAL